MGKFWTKLFKSGIQPDALATKLRDALSKVKSSAKANSLSGWNTKGLVYGGLGAIGVTVAGWLGYNEFSDVAEQIPFTENSCDRSFEKLFHEHYEILETALGKNAAIALVGMIRMVSALPPGASKIACDEFLTNYIVGLDLATAAAWRGICAKDGDPSFAAYRAGIESAADLAVGHKSNGVNPGPDTPANNELNDLLEEESGKKETAPNNSTPVAASFENFWSALEKVGNKLGYTPSKKEAKEAYTSASSDQRPFDYELNKSEDLALAKEGVKGLFAIKGGDLLRKKKVKPAEESQTGTIKEVPPYKIVTGFISARVYTLIKSTLPAGTKMNAIMPFISAFYMDNILPTKQVAMSLENFAMTTIRAKDFNPQGTIKLRYAQTFNQNRFRQVSDSMSKSELDSAAAVWKQYVLDRKDKAYLGVVDAETAWGKKINDDGGLV